MLGVIFAHSCLLKCDVVSIRTPVLGVIQPLSLDAHNHCVSIRTPVLGVILPVIHNTPRETVSIRTPVLGVMAVPAGIAALGQCFNPHPRVGGDLASRWLGSAASCFNPHPRVGGDVCGYHLRHVEIIVSIRTPVLGVITAASRETPRIESFQSAPPCWG